MPQHLDTWQVNMLVTGQALAAEIPTPSPHSRAWIYITSYSIDSADSTRRSRPSKFLNADYSDVRFRLRVFEVADDDMPNVLADPWNSDYYERDIAHRNGIASMQDLEATLSAYMDDFSVLINAVKMDYFF